MKEVYMRPILEIISFAPQKAIAAGLTDAEIDCIIQYMNGNLDYTP